MTKILRRSGINTTTQLSYGDKYSFLPYSRLPPSITFSSKKPAPSTTMAPTAEESNFYFFNIHGDRWPVVIIEENLLTNEDKDRRPRDAYYIPVLAVDTDDDV
jgi:hypothetical protein